MRIKGSTVAQLSNGAFFVLQLLNNKNKRRIWLNCRQYSKPSGPEYRCGHVGQISVQDPIKVFGGDVDLDAVERTARCTKCKGKSISSVQVICIEGSFDAMHSSHTPKDNKDW